VLRRKDPCGLLPSVDARHVLQHAVRVKGKYVTGYLTGEACSLKDDGYKTERRAHVFRHHNGQDDLLPEWPSTFTQELFDLLGAGEETVRP
jgi:hypothetical protein